MDDWVAVEVRTDTAQTGFFITWGRIQDAVDPGPLEGVILRAATRFQIGGKPLSARVCSSLKDAASQPYFYEALLAIAQKPIPYGQGFEAWRRERAEAMNEGRDIYFLGQAADR